MTGQPTALHLSPSAKERLKILFLAKWAEGAGVPDGEDGTHSTYHHDLRRTLEGLGFNIEASGRYERLFEKPDYDFLFTLYNRGGFTNSEMLGPLMAVFHRVPFLGASPIIRGMADDKHLMKLAVRARGVNTPDWAIYRRGTLKITPPDFPYERLIIKPNASSASWGIKLVERFEDGLEHIQELMQHGHDVIVENFVDGFEMAVPVIGSHGPWLLPTVRFTVPDVHAVRSYAQKRHLDDVDNVKLSILEDDHINGLLRGAVESVLPEIWPFDYGRFEFKYDAATDRLNFIELNLSCNLWERKASAVSWASLNLPYESLIETILCHSLLRQNVVTLADIQTRRVA